MSRLMTKPIKWHVHPAKTQISLGICPVWSEFSLWAQWVAKDLSFLHADRKDSDQTGRMPRLILVVAGRTCHFVGFVMRWLKYENLVYLQCSKPCKTIEDPLSEDKIGSVMMKGTIHSEAYVTSKSSVEDAEKVHTSFPYPLNVHLLKHRESWWNRYGGEFNGNFLQFSMKTSCQLELLWSTHNIRFYGEI